MEIFLVFLTQFICATYNVLKNIFTYDMFRNVASAFVIALLFFLLKEWLLKLPDITGRWYVETYTNETRRDEYKNMKVGYIVVLWRSGNLIKGTREKIYDQVENKEKQDYKTEDITRADLEGSLEQNYFPFFKSKLYLHVEEKGKQRETTEFYTIIVDSDKCLKGDFKSTAADQEGTTKWKREKFS